MRRWPRQTKSLFGGTEDAPWIKAQPKDEGFTATTPFILTAGAPALKTQPDGMFIRPINDAYALDVVCFEVCSSLPNLQDKRFRYSPTTASLVVEIQPDWWREPIHGRVTRHEKAFLERDRAIPDWPEWYPIRYLRTVFVLRKDDLERFRSHGVAAGHEYYMRNNSLGSINSTKFLDFLKRLSPNHHFYTK